MSDVAFEKHLPGLFIEQLGLHATTEPFSLRLPAAVMITDISGFSALATELTRNGAHGVESLQETLDRYFGWLGAVVQRFGGDISTFAGDAVIAVWPANGNPQQAASRALQCALAIQREPHTGWQGPAPQLTQRAAVSLGELMVCKLGGVGGKWLPVMAGTSVLDAGRACDITPPGQVLVTAQVAALLQGRLRAVPAADNCWRVDDFDAASTVLPDTAPARPAPVPEALAPYLPDVLVRRSGAGRDEWLAEFRLVTVMLVKLDNLAFDRPDAEHTLQTVACAVQEKVQRYGGALPYLQMDDKGLNFVIAFGLPTAAHEDDAARALLTGLEIQRALRELGLRPAIGAATGVLFCGECGASHRRQYSMFGPAINFAARLAGATPDDLLSDEQTTKAAGDRLSFTIAQNVLAKHGQAGELAFRPEWRQARSGAERLAAMVGREAEVQQILGALEPGGGGRTGASRLLVVGEPGIGKSRLLQEVALRAASAGMAVITGSAQAIDSTTPYSWWREVLGGLLVQLAMPTETAAQTLGRALQGQPQLQSWAPLLNDVLPLALPASPLTSEMRGAARAASMQQLLQHLLELALDQGPLVLLVNDFHWTDVTSADTLVALAGRVARLPIVVTTRPPEPQASLATPGFEQLPRLLRIPLSTLSAAQTAEMVARILGTTAVPEALGQLIHDRSEGNPFYVQQLTLALREAGQIETSGGRCQLKPGIAGHLAGAMPGTLRGVIASRVDALPEDLQLLLKQASVFGRSFSARALAALHPSGQQAQPPASMLARLADSSLVGREPTAGDDGYAFSHALVQEAIYELLPLVQRRRQHHRIADWLEQHHGASIAGYHSVLADHCIRAEEYPRALLHLEGGAEVSMRQSAYRQAIGQIELAQRLAQEQQLADDQLRQARWFGLLADSHHELSEYTQARSHYGQALALLGRPYQPGPLARSFSILGHLARQARSRLGPASTAGRAHTAQAPEAERLASHAYARLAEISYHENQPQAVLHLTLLSVNLAEQAGARSEMAAGYGALAVACGQAGMAGVAKRYAQRGIALAESRPSHVNDIAYAHLLAMVHASSQCDWPVLDTSGAHAEKLYGELGDRFRQASAQALLLAGAGQRCRWDEYEALLARMSDRSAAGALPRVQGWIRNSRLQLALMRGMVEHAEVAAHAGSAAGIESLVDRMMILGSCATAWVRLGDLGSARRDCKLGLELLLGRTPVAGAGYVFGPLGLVEALLASPGLLGGEHQQQLAAACAVLKTYTQQVPSTRPRGYYLLGCHASQQGKPALAIKRWQQAVQAARQLGMPYDEAQALQSLGLALGQGQTRAPDKMKDAQQAAQHLFTSLGVPAPKPLLAFHQP